MTKPQGISNILAIRFARLGDVALLLPSLIRLKASFGDARLTLATGSRCAPLAELCPQLDAVISVDRLAMRDDPRFRALADIYRLIRELRFRRFDLVVDFQSFRETNLLAWISRARYRVGMKRSDRAYLSFCFNLDPALEDKNLHVADMFRLIVDHVPGIAPSTPAESPVIEVPPNVQATIGRWGNQEPILALYVGASVAARRWPASRFAALAEHASAEWDASVLIVAGASAIEESIAREIQLGAGSSGRVHLLTGLTIPEMAGAIASARMLVSNDTGPMHIGSALGVPTLGIFSSSLPQHYRPIGPSDRYIKKDSIEDVRVEEVVRTMNEMWITATPDRRL